MCLEAKDKVSIVVPIYNQEKYLDVSISALINQKYNNLEIILVNDGSTDSSHIIIKRYANKDSRIRIVEKENGGLVDAILTGIANATGEYIAFLDPDDTIGIDFISTFFDAMDDDYDFIAAGIYYDNGDSLRPLYLEKDKCFSINEMKKLRMHYLLGNSSSDPNLSIFHGRWNKLYRTRCVKQAAEEFVEYKSVTLGEDTIFTYLMLLHVEKGKVIRNPNSYYYNVSNQNSMMKSSSIDTYMEKTRHVYCLYTELMEKYGERNEQPYMLYYMLSESLLNRAQSQGIGVFSNVYFLLRKDEIYQKSIRSLVRREVSWRKKGKIYFKIIISNPKLYLFSLNILKHLVGSQSYGSE